METPVRRDQVQVPVETPVHRDQVQVPVPGETPVHRDQVPTQVVLLHRPQDHDGVQDHVPMVQNGSGIFGVARRAFGAASAWRAWMASQVFHNDKRLDFDVSSDEFGCLIGECDIKLTDIETNNPITKKQLESKIKDQKKYRKSKAYDLAEDAKTTASLKQQLKKIQGEMERKEKAIRDADKTVEEHEATIQRKDLELKIVEAIKLKKLDHLYSSATASELHQIRNNWPSMTERECQSVLREVKRCGWFKSPYMLHKNPKIHMGRRRVMAGDGAQGSQKESQYSFLQYTLALVQYPHYHDIPAPTVLNGPSLESGYVSATSSVVSAPPVQEPVQEEFDWEGLINSTDNKDNLNALFQSNSGDREFLKAWNKVQKGKRKLAPVPEEGTGELGQGACKKARTGDN